MKTSHFVMTRQEKTGITNRGQMFDRDEREIMVQYDISALERRKPLSIFNERSILNTH